MITVKKRNIPELKMKIGVFRQTTPLVEEKYFLNVSQLHEESFYL